MPKNQGYRTATLVAAFWLTAGLAHAAGTYKFSTFDPLGGSQSAGSALNRAGVVVGWASQPEDNGDPPMEPNRPAKWTGPVATDLGTLQDGPYGYAKGINDSGAIVGDSYLPESGGVHATLWRNGSVTDLGTLGGQYSYAYAINRGGVIVGSASTSGDVRHRAIVWKNGQPRVLKDLGGHNHRAVAISNNGYIAGMSTDRSEVGHAVVWKDGVLTDLGTGRQLSGINSYGVAVGYAAAQSPGVTTVEATLWNGSVPTYLGCLAAGFQCMANAVNDDGVIVGESRIDDGNDNHAAMWVNGRVVDLNDQLDQVTRDAGWVLLTAQAINGRGFITGTARNTLTGAVRAYLLSR